MSWLKDDNMVYISVKMSLETAARLDRYRQWVGFETIGEAMLDLVEQEMQPEVTIAGDPDDLHAAIDLLNTCDGDTGRTYEVHEVEEQPNPEPGDTRHYQVYSYGPEDTCENCFNNQNAIGHKVCYECRDAESALIK